MFWQILIASFIIKPRTNYQQICITDIYTLDFLFSKTPLPIATYAQILSRSKTKIES